MINILIFFRSEFLTDFILTKRNNSHAAKKLFYGVFNTPEEMPTGTAICFYDIDDVESVFQWENFDFENLGTLEINKIDKIN